LLLSLHKQRKKASAASGTMHEARERIRRGNVLRSDMMSALRSWWVLMVPE
jgi:hypothetical protein